QVFDHTSVAQFLERRFAINVPGITPWHRAVCGDLCSAFDFSGATDIQPALLPSTANWAELEEGQKAMPPYRLPDAHQPLFQEPGTRPSRALPYELHVNALR